MKKIICVILAVSMCLSLVACGEQEITQKATQQSSQPSAQTSSSNEQPLNTEPEKKTLVKFDRSPEWDSVEWMDKPFQIDETMVYLSQNIDEVINKLQSSSVEYEINYNKDRILEKNEEYTINVLLQGKKWVDLLVINSFDDLTSLSKCPLMYITIHDAAMEYCRLVDGRTLAELQNITFDELKSDEFAKKISLYKAFIGETKIDNQAENQILIYFNSYSARSDPESTNTFCPLSRHSVIGHANSIYYDYDYDYGVVTSLVYYALLNKDTGKIDKFSTYYKGYNKEGYVKDSYLYSFNDVNPESIEILREAALNNCYLFREELIEKWGDIISKYDKPTELENFYLCRGKLYVIIKIASTDTYRACISDIKVDENKNVVDFTLKRLEDHDAIHYRNYEDEPLNGFMQL